jgi:hypothetical protein
MWIAVDGGEVLGGIIWSAHPKDTGTQLWVDFIFGKDMSEWLPGLMDLGRDMKDIVGAYTIEASCRRGLAKVLERYGWRRKAVIMEL